MTIICFFNVIWLADSWSRRIINVIPQFTGYNTKAYQGLHDYVEASFVEDQVHHPGY